MVGFGYIKVREYFPEEQYKDVHHDCKFIEKYLYFVVMCGVVELIEELYYKFFYLIVGERNARWIFYLNSIPGIVVEGGLYYEK